MAKNVKIAGASYSDVPAIEVPTTTGGTATFIDEDDIAYDTPSISVSTGGLITASANGKSNTSQLNTQAAKTVTPSESEQTAVANQTYTTGVVKFGAISTTYVGSEIARRTSSDLTASGATVTVPSGYYSAQATKSVASGTAGTPSATKGTVSNNQISITPTVTNTTGYITGGTKTGNAVIVKASDLVSGSETKTANGTYDVTNLKELVVNVSQSGGGLPTGFTAIATGTHTLNSAVAGGSTFTVNHNLGVVPDMFIFYATSNIATTYSMLMAMRSPQLGWRSTTYLNKCFYHGNSTTTVTGADVTTTYGIKTLTATQATVTTYSNSGSYYWRAGTYKWIAIKFS